MSARVLSGRAATIVGRLSLVALWSLLFVLIVWATAALYFDLPWPWARAGGALIFGGIMLLIPVFLRPWRRVALAWAAGFLPVLCWWLTLKPSNTRNWQPDVARAPWAEIRGDVVTLHNVRNCEYLTKADYVPRWETRQVRLSRLKGIDIALSYWGSAWMAHPVVSFQFTDAPPVAISIEARKEVGEGYSAVRGFFRQYELIYVLADERDVLRLRTNYRDDHEVYLYRTKATPEQARGRFLEYMARLNALHDRPAWYHALTANCTTSIRTQRAADERAPFDWRMIANGKADEMAYERGALVGDLPFAQLKARSAINSRGRAADAATNYSELIRRDMPW